MIVVAGTGHRPDKLGGYQMSATQRRVRSATRRVLEKLKCDRVISGLALGFDQWLALEAIALKIPVTAAIPFVGQERVWPQSSRELYAEILAQCDQHAVISPGGYAPWKMQARNTWMVDHCDVLLACWDGSDGGTANCLLYARNAGCPTVRINPTNTERVNVTDWA